jgi:hypothetical protein
VPRFGNGAKYLGHIAACYTRLGRAEPESKAEGGVRPGYYIAMIDYDDGDSEWTRLPDGDVEMLSGKRGPPIE